MTIRYLHTGESTGSSWCNNRVLSLRAHTRSGWLMTGVGHTRWMMKGVGRRLKKAAGHRLKKGVDHRLKKGVDHRLKKGVGRRLKKGAGRRLKKGVDHTLKGVGVGRSLKGSVELLRASHHFYQQRMGSMMVNDYLTARSRYTVSSNTPPPLAHRTRYSSAARKKMRLRGTWDSDRDMSDRCCNVEGDRGSG